MAVTPWGAQVTALFSSNSDDENVEQLPDDGPPQPKPGQARKSSPRKKTNNGDTTASHSEKTRGGDAATLEELHSMVQHLVQNSDETLWNSKETLRLQRLRYEALSSDSESEPLAKRGQYSSLYGSVADIITQVVGRTRVKQRLLPKSPLAQRSMRRPP